MQIMSQKGEPEVAKPYRTIYSDKMAEVLDLKLWCVLCSIGWPNLEKTCRPAESQRWDAYSYMDRKDTQMDDDDIAAISAV